MCIGLLVILNSLAGWIYSYVIQPFPSPFVFPSGQACRNFDQLATACRQQWKESLEMLRQGFFGAFLGTIGRGISSSTSSIQTPIMSHPLATARALCARARLTE